MNCVIVVGANPPWLPRFVGVGTLGTTPRGCPDSWGVGTGGTTPTVCTDLGLLYNSKSKQQRFLSKLYISLSNAGLNLSFSLFYCQVDFN